MRITAISDFHGDLPEIENTDLLLICGDFSPLEIQQSISGMKAWITDKMIPWFAKINAKKIVFIAGNHDFICVGETWRLGENVFSYDFNKDFLLPLLKKNGLEHKVSYLCNSSVVFDGLKIFGCPYVSNLRGWAFCLAEEQDMYSKIKKCDILLTHQAPMIEGLGVTSFLVNDFNGKMFERKIDFGSLNLFTNITKKAKPKYAFCGHIHNGNHNEATYKYKNGEVTRFYNVSLKNEDYEMKYDPLVIDV